ncbi:hypothetical protein F511_13857 [Dorcoceras hygrometricum]|uniref:Uncharacterized protein n=1 Tax=Dorcoceras hygrometricum TaxID=472368 RepID=A0A2Z7DCJ0_9LAMI|nr:hypothetical protein F511_13857 [Dorcoceras hygrometricum]
MHDAKVGRTPEDALQDRDLPEASPLFRECFRGSCPGVMKSPAQRIRGSRKVSTEIFFLHRLSPSINISIVGASPDTLLTPSDLWFVVADIKEERRAFPSLDARRHSLRSRRDGVSGNLAGQSGSSAGRSPHP